MSDRSFAYTVEALRSLERLPAFRIPLDMTPFGGVAFSCPQIKKALANLDKVPALTGPSKIDENLLEKWAQFLSSNRETPLTLRDIRNLCWEPRVALQPAFQEVLERQEKSLSASSIQGLVFSYHSEYTKVAGDSGIEGLITRLINGRGQFMSSLAPWRAQLPSILGHNAASAMAEKITKPGVDFQQSFQAERIFPNTTFAAHAASKAVLNYVDIFSTMTSDEVAHLYNSIISAPLIERDTYKRAVSRLILQPIHERNEDLRRQLLAYIMTGSGLRDPRIHIETWIGFDESAKQRVIQWLSSQEIDFFFGLLIGRADPHGRKAFWMEYVSKIYRSRALLSLRDRESYQRQLRELAERGTTYANLKSAASSAFILDFGRLVVVEFSTVGSVYFYDQTSFQRILPEFWSGESSSDQLKRKDLAIDSVRHTSDWQQKVRNILSRYGIRR